MPAKKDDRQVSVEYLKNALRVLYKSVAPDTDDCIVWKSTANGDAPFIKTTQGKSGTNISVSVRDAICAGRKGAVVMTCDTHFCVNQRHMQRVPHARPRDIGQPRGASKHHHGIIFLDKLSLEGKLAAAKMLEAGATQASVAKHLGVSQSTISRVKRMGE